MIRFGNRHNWISRKRSKLTFLSNFLIFLSVTIAVIAAENPKLDYLKNVAWFIAKLPPTLIWNKTILALYRNS